MTTTDPGPDTPVAAGESPEWSWNPDLPIRNSPVFAWPPKPVAAFKWLTLVWVQLSSHVLYVALALLILAVFQPDTAVMQTLSTGWVAQIWLRDLVMLLVVAGGLHFYLYNLAAQGTRYKFDARPMMKNNGTYTFRDQVWDNMYWTLVFGLTIWVVYEVLYFWAAANGLAPHMSFTDTPVWFVIWLSLLWVWQSFHFYWVHRLLHWPPLYRRYHALHHRNVNVGPWTGLSMHPVEHLGYYSSLLIHFVVPSHPLHVLVHIFILTLGAVISHAGFEGFLVRDKKQMVLGDFHHQLHHKYFECNYGTVEMPWDAWFGSFHNGTPEATKRIRARKKRIMGR